MPAVLPSTASDATVSYPVSVLLCVALFPCARFVCASFVAVALANRFNAS
jgi:hypothetical protein